MTKTRTRESWIDWSKAILIWLMVLGHAGLSGQPRMWVYAFHMPAFFIISGFLYKPHNWLLTLKKFCVPIAFFSLLNLGYLVLRMAAKGDHIDAGELFLRTTPPYWRCNYGDYITLFRGVWFVVVLACMRALSGDIPLFSFIRKHALWFIVLCLGYMTLEPLFESYTEALHDYYAYRVIGCLPFMLIGMMMKTHREWFLHLSWKWLTVLAAAFAATTLTNGPIEIWAYIFGRHYLLFFIAAIAGSIVLFSIFRATKPNTVIETFSTGTLLILGIHTPILGVCLKGCEMLHLPYSSVASSLLVMLLCYYPIKWANQHCPILLGK